MTEGGVKVSAEYYCTIFPFILYRMLAYLLTSCDTDNNVSSYNRFQKIFWKPRVGGDDTLKVPEFFLGKHLLIR